MEYHFRMSNEAFPTRSDLPEAYRRRLGHTLPWYTPARFGLFYHLGLFTGGGNASSSPTANVPLFYKTPADFERAAPDPTLLARNLAATAVDAGARYTILTVWHTCAGSMVLYPTRLAEFRHKTTLDYIGAYLDEAHKAGIHPMLYLPCDCHNWDAPGVAPAVTPEVAKSLDLYAILMCRALDEIKERYGDAPEGFWLDGGIHDGTRIVPAYIRSLWPNAVIVGNGCPELPYDDLDYGTAEGDAIGADPPFDRTGPFRKMNPWGGTAARRDFIEDIPTPNNWWYHGEEPVPGGLETRYVEDRFLLLREMISSLGQRGLWNFAPGIGPRIDGTVPEALKPSLQTIRAFLDWAGEAIYGTRGAEGTFFVPGYLSYRGSIGYCSVMTSLDNPSVFYALVQEAPSACITLFDTCGHRPKRITDLRTGAELWFRMQGGPILEGVDWSDVGTYGAKVLKFEFD